MTFKTAAILGAAISLFSSLSAAQVVLEAGVARAEETWGGEFGIGYTIFSLGGLRLTPGAGAFVYQGDNERYYMDDNGGNPRCRDSDTGQYAAREKCDATAVEGYARAELTYSLPTSLTFGIGGRYMSDRFRTYGTIEFPLLPKIRLKASGGSNYCGAGLIARF